MARRFDRIRQWCRNVSRSVEKCRVPPGGGGSVRSERSAGYRFPIQRDSELVPARSRGANGPLGATNRVSCRNVGCEAAAADGGERRNVMKSDELGWTRFTVSVNSTGAGWVAGGDTLRVPRRHAWVPSARRSEAVDQAPRPSVSPSGSGLIAAQRDGLHLSRNGSSGARRNGVAIRSRRTPGE